MASFPAICCLIFGYGLISGHMLPHFRVWLHFRPYPEMRQLTISQNVLQQKEIQINLPALKSFLKTKLLEISRNRCQQKWDTENTGRNMYKIILKTRNNPTFWHRGEILFTSEHELFPTYLNRFRLRSEAKGGCGDQEVSFTMPQNDH
ncbi:hypothetical protein AVEN_36366-1 [Araneus ventricosus]|uniref:Uncharacterized protein n=1 Tax=Araneus ventricosus TaxID=182803 RepID=A0A4Y2G7Q5_ARAVE|nr:hypothetical protein AVEN_36366-1 [Araneus ventricosus]